MIIIAFCFITTPPCPFSCPFYCHAFFPAPFPLSLPLPLPLHPQVVLQRNLPGTPEEEEEEGKFLLETQHIQLIQIVVVFILIMAV